MVRRFFDTFGRGRKGPSGRWLQGCVVTLGIFVFSVTYGNGRYFWDRGWTLLVYDVCNVLLALCYGYEQFIFSGWSCSEFT